MNIGQKTVLLILALILSSIPLTAQRRSGINILEGLTITPRGGYNMFFGDLVDESRGSYSFGVLADREMNEFLSVRTQLIGGKMQGKQVYPSSGLMYAEFDNVYAEFSVGGAYRPLNHLLGYFKERTFQPYAHLNTGIVYFSATEYWGPASQGTPGDEWRSASGIAPMVSMGGGATIWINPVLSLNVELDGTLPFSDQIDAHDVWYNTYEDWENRVNPNSTKPHDFYYTFTLGITFIIQDSKFSNDPKYNRRSYIKTRSYYQSKSKRSPARKRNKKGFLFF
jgi:hypothetical protein